MTDNTPLPPIEHQPPYSLDFIAHLHGGRYPRDATKQLLATVAAYTHGAAVLQALTRTTFELQLLGLSAPNEMRD